MIWCDALKDGFGFHEWINRIDHLESKSALHLVYNTIIAWKLSIMEGIRLVPDSRRSEGYCTFSATHLFRFFLFRL